MSNKQLLSIYLNDHLAGSIIALELANRSAASNKGTPLGDALKSVAGEFEEDQRHLEQLMAELGITKNILKEAFAWMSEKAGRLKLNGRLVGYSDLSRLVELEALSLGVEAKLAMWKNLNEIATSIPELATGDLGRFVKRAEIQLDQLEALRPDAARRALA